MVSSCVLFFTGRLKERALFQFIDAEMKQELIRKQSI
jgi:hypothetical protein